jgi:hypothetical protein
MNAEINSTADHYIHGTESLGWELTVCNALYPENSPCRRILRRNASYGHLLYDYLNRFVPMDEIESIIEIGGGYGYLMKDFLNRNRSLKVTMLDISPFLSERQRETLKGFEVSFLVEDFLDTDIHSFRGRDMAVLNENLGDFPTAVDIPGDSLRALVEVPGEILRRVRGLFDRYVFEEPETEFFNLNIGAIEALEKLCASGTPCIFLSEHSCEAKVPEPYRGLIHISSSRNPEKITLKGHHEYTLNFSHLERVARAFHYHVIRGPLADYIEIDFNERIRFVLASKVALSDESEIIRHFMEDLYKYEYLILIKT